jgi:hypothetical protein
LRIILRPTGDGARAVIEATTGRLSGPDHFITIEEIFTASSADDHAAVLSESAAVGRGAP